MRGRVFQIGLLLAALCRADAAEAAPTPKEIIDHVLDVNPWGQTGCELVAHAAVRDERGGARELRFRVRALRYAPGLSKSMIRFTSPAEISGASFLQVQKSGGDDDRYLFLPELKRSRRVGGETRSGAFMGTDFSYADLDQHDLRDSSAKIEREVTVGKHACWLLKVQPTGSGPYAKIELTVRKDNFVPLKMMMYNKAGVLLKTSTTSEVRRVGGRWFITKLTMQTHQLRRQTDFLIDSIDVKTKIREEEFTVRTLEKP